MDDRCCRRTWPADAPADPAPGLDPADNVPAESHRARAAATALVAIQSHTWRPARWANANGSGRRRQRQRPLLLRSAARDDDAHEHGRDVDVDDAGGDDDAAGPVHVANAAAARDPCPADQRP